MLLSTLNHFLDVKYTRKTRSFFSPPWVSPQGVPEPRTWWIPPDWEGTSRREHIAGCWALLHFREWRGHQQTLPEEMSQWPYQEESQRRPGRWWNTVSRLNCWSPLMRWRHRICVFSIETTVRKITQMRAPILEHGKPHLMSCGAVCQDDCTWGECCCWVASPQ